MDGLPYGSIEESDLKRMFTCGYCSLSVLDEIDMGLVMDTVRNELDAVSKKLENIESGRGDHEVSEAKKKKRRREYNAATKEKRRLYMRAYRFRKGGFIPTDL